MTTPTVAQTRRVVYFFFRRNVMERRARYRISFYTTVEYISPRVACSTDVQTMIFILLSKLRHTLWNGYVVRNLNLWCKHGELIYTTATAECFAPGWNKLFLLQRACADVTRNVYWTSCCQRTTLWSGPLPMRASPSKWDLASRCSRS